jgi:predicted Zn-dependent peptidase
MHHHKKLLSLVSVTLLLLVAASGQSQSFAELEDQVQELRLENGMRFLVLEDHQAPVFTFVTYVNAGSVNEVTGITGIAHLLEHMAFKGTPQIGTNDFAAEQEAMAAEDAAFAALKAERARGRRADPEKLAALEQAFDEVKETARSYVVSNEYGQIVEHNGGVGINAGTGADATVYFYSFPSNRLELWAYLESNRMAYPVLRELYTEKDGPVTEERRMRVDNNPIGLLMEQFMNMAFSAHPYHHRGIGYMSDLETIDRSDVQAFYERHYVGSNMTVAVVGDVSFAEVKRLAEKYFSVIPSGEAPAVETVEPKQLGEKRIIVKHSSQPLLLLGYHIGSINHPDNAGYEAIADILAQGRTSRLYTLLVKERKLASQVFGMTGFPGNKYPNLMIFFVIPSKDVTAFELEEIVYQEIARLADEGATAEELEGVKQRARASFIRSLQGNRGMAMQLASYQTLTGDWREMFRQIDKIESVTLDDIKRIAGEIFVESNRTVAIIDNTDTE